MDVVIITDANGKEVQRSRNLRGIIARSGRIPVRSVGISESMNTRAVLTVCWSDGSRVFTEFADYRVLKAWVRKRNAFQGAALFVCGIRSGQVTRRNPL